MGDAAAGGKPAGPAQAIKSGVKRFSSLAIWSRSTSLRFFRRAIRI